ncbi:MAG: ABC transporter ATP-binding protein [Veillonellales bacterium]
MSGIQQESLAVEHVTIAIGEKTILEDVSFFAGAGEFIGIIGPNGAGKSTLLRGLRGMQPVTAGDIRVFQQPVGAFGDKQMARMIAYMQQEVNVGFGFTAMEVVLAGRYPYLKWWQNESKEDYRIAQRYMTFTGVEKLADQPVQQVSGGERQRILLAKVLAQETPLIFLDEPTASLDLVYQEEIFRYCQTMCEQGKTILIIAHDLKLAAKFCSRLILLAKGTVVADGVPPEVITVENLERAYGLHAAVFMNKITGNLDIHTYAAAGVSTLQKKVHIIGGGGASGDIIRVLHERGYQLSGGVFQQGDTDADVADAFELDSLTGPPFCGIDAALAKANREKIIAADWTVLGSLCFGEQNLDNLAAAFSAAKLIVIEDLPVEERDFTGGKAAQLYRDLVCQPQVTVMTTEEFLNKLADG